MGTILVVEDDQDIRGSVAEVLTDEGHTVLEAGDGGEALEVLSTMATRPCLVLLDLMMPRMNGTAFLAFIGDDPKLAKLQIVIFSAFATGVYRNVRRVLTKPMSLEDLLGVVEEFCSPSYTA